MCVLCSAANSQNNEDGHFWLSGSKSDGCDCKLIEEGESKDIKGIFSSTGCQNLFTGQRWVRQGSCLVNPPGMSLFPSCYRRVHVMAAAWECGNPGQANPGDSFIYLFSQTPETLLKTFLM